MVHHVDTKHFEKKKNLYRSSAGPQYVLVCSDVA